MCRAPAGYQDGNPSTHQGVDMDKTSMQEVYTKFGLEVGTQDFIGHAMALYQDDHYKRQPARETYNRIMLYTSSVARYGKSPYIYPLYGLGELPQGFARLSAIYGGTYMLDKPVDEIVYNAEGQFEGVRSGDETVKAKMVIGDPSYFLEDKKEERVIEEAKVVRAICFLKHPIPNTDESNSVQLIIPQNQVGRKNGEPSSAKDIRTSCSGLSGSPFVQTSTSPRSRHSTMSCRRTCTLRWCRRLSRRQRQSASSRPV